MRKIVEHIRPMGALLVVAVLTMGTGSCFRVTPYSATIDIGETVQLSVTSLFGLDYYSAYSWATADETKATVDETGLVTGVGAGNVLITVTGTNSSKGAINKASATITVRQGTGPAVTVTPPNSTLDIDQTVQLGASSTDALDTSFAWGSSNAAVASVNTNGKVTANAAGGPVTITATGSNSGQSGTASVRVNAPPLVTVTVTPPNNMLEIGQMVQLGASSTDALDTSFAWGSSNAAIASVDTNGLVAANALGGPVTITATGSNSGQSGTASVTVNAAPPATVTVTPPNSTLEIGQMVQLGASSTDTLDTSFSWGSSNATVASVDSTGKVTANAEGGPVTITATGSNSGQSGTASVTVNPASIAPPLVGLDANKPTVLPFTVQAAYNDDTMFFHMSWEGDLGDTHDYFRYTSNAWQREGGPRRDAQATLDNDPLRGSTSVNSTIYESRVTFMLDDPSGPNAVPMFGEIGCMVTCHDNSRAMPTWVNADGEVHKYLPDDAAFAGKRLDLWHHRLARANPIGLSDDQWVGQRIGADADGGGGSRHGDAGTGPYATASFTGGLPQWAFDSATTGGLYAFDIADLFTTPIYFFTDPTAQNIGPNAPNALGIDYADAITAGYVPGEGDTVPRRRLRQTVGSRGDITAIDTTFAPSMGDPLFGRWESNIQRLLVTGNSDDTALAHGSVYNIAFALHTGMVTVRDHYVSFPFTLSLNGGAADIQATQIAGVTGTNSLPDFSNTTAFPVTSINLFLPGITSYDFVIGANTGGTDYIDPETSSPVDQSHAGAFFLLNSGLGCRDCHTSATSDPFTPVNLGGFESGAMETLVLQRGGVNTRTPIPAPAP